MMVSSYWFEISPEHYLVDASNNRDKSVCILAFASNDSDFFLIGDSFFRGYYAIHDDDHDRIGFAPHSESKKSAPSFAKYPPSQSLQLSFFVKYKKECWMAVAALLILTGFLIFGTQLWPKFKKWYNGDLMEMGQNGKLIVRIN